MHGRTGVAIGFAGLAVALVSVYLGLAALGSAPWPPWGRANPISSLLDDARAAEERGEWGQALVLLDTVLDVDPRNPDALALRGEAHLSTCGWHEALRDLTAALDGGVSSRVQVLRGLAFLYVGARDEALADMSSAILQDSESAIAYLNRGAILTQMGRFAEAERDLRTAIGIEPGFSQAYFNLGVLLTFTEDFEGAEAALTHALELWPEYSQALDQRGHVRAVQGDFEGAAADFDAAVAADPYNTHAMRNRAALLADQGRSDLADADLAEAELVERVKDHDGYCAPPNRRELPTEVE